MRANRGRSGTLAWAVLACAGVTIPGCAGEPGGIAVGAVETLAGPGSQAPSLATAGDRVVLSWLEPDGEGVHALRFAVRTPDGIWESAGTVVASDSLWANWADVPSIQPRDDGRWIAHWLHRVGAGTYAYHVRMAVSTDEGRTWSASFRPHTDLSETEHGFAALVPWSDGWAGLWLDGRRTAVGGPMTLRFTTISDAGVPAPDLEVDEQVCDCCQTSVARTATGLIAVYRDRAEGEIRDIASRRFDGAAWSAPRPVSVDGWHYPGCPVNGPQVDARGDTAVVAWFTGADDTPRVYAAFSTDGGMTWSARRRVDDGRPTGRVDVLWWGDRAVVSWLEETDGIGALRIREVGPTGRPARSTTVATTTVARAAGFPRMARHGDAVILAWTDPADTGGVRAVALRRTP